jgi:hypothetical protein
MEKSLKVKYLPAAALKKLFPLPPTGSSTDAADVADAASLRKGALFA